MTLTQQLQDRSLRVNDLSIPIGKRLRYRVKGNVDIDDCRPRVLTHDEARNKQRLDDWKARRGW
ncbi:hypothetical protein LMG33818_000919 [Halomonadaceae bacterium LMG 33818]|uniref:hypothetical protein n=1 Tax=Cernens ardua TaxID=3402176 RepID=UPI003EDC3919